MENASKALIMAGSILMALLTIGALIFMFDNISGVEKQKDQNAEIDAVLKFNRQFEVFDIVGLRGTDILTVINKILDYNRKTKEDNQGYNYVQMSITFKSNIDETLTASETSPKILSLVYNENETDETKDHGTGLQKKYNEWFGHTSNELNDENLKEFKRKYFKCTGIGYDNTSGRVNNMTFEEIVVH